MKSDALMTSQENQAMPTEDPLIVVIPDREGKFFWAFFVSQMTVVSHERHDTQELAHKAGAAMRERILQL